ncbi:MAG TPA: L,D-transpeptidase [Nocardioides sp.]|uniref:L,D-transpeptidase n=1 Tax=Nocardioides sp. TaxID=35761 RepID=UPI002D104928|nr:L,D-transpeptidase [Nocardioides sp.]HTW15717.1 L,D-transpeptidase [Nocardioides sp.]
MSRHRATAVRPRYGRISVLGAALAVTLVAVLGGTGALPAALSGTNEPSAAIVRDGQGDPTPAPAAPTAEAEAEVEAEVQAEIQAEAVQVDPAADTTLPADSGSGRRIVFSESRQRVWLVEDGERVRRTYLASGSLSDNLDPGTYDVYSRSENAVGIDDSGTMKYFVRFTRGNTGAAIGFHDIPVDEGKPVQTVAQLGTPQSHGCIRQRRADAIALWKFAPLGTTVVVTA